ncbi:helix-turn-helix domain-containing protein [Caldisphaera sp.]|uniref:helix-turn-helix domain-containing protein n=1 Tax=Caldisphaera sp. TaxID=2060322 RepID=UPI003D0EA8C7
MIILDLSIKSNCSLSKMAHDFNGEVLSFSVSQFSKGMNSIIAFVTLKEKNQETLMKSWKKRYEDFSYLNWDKIGEKSILFNGLKEGHGIVNTLIEYKGALITPTIAGDGYERFLILIKNKKDIDYIIKDISRNNNVIDFNYNDVNMKSLLSWISKMIIEASNINNREYEILSKAYNYGYFSWPKEINLEELSLKLGVSQPTIIYHIRNAINKILSNILSDF